jgi:hypothetical protein
MMTSRDTYRINLFTTILISASLTASCWTNPKVLGSTDNHRFSVWYDAGGVEESL